MIEAFVGIAVLLIGVVGPMVLVNRNFQASRFSRDQITAYYLAQEAIEVIRQVRDDNLLSGRPWNNSLSKCVSGCRVNGNVVGNDANKLQAHTCEGATPGSTEETACNRHKTLRVVNGTFGHNIGGYQDESNYMRWVEFDDIGDGYRARVYVDFNTGRYIQSYETTTIITNWMP